MLCVTQLLAGRVSRGTSLAVEYVIFLTSAAMSRPLSTLACSSDAAYGYHHSSYVLLSTEHVTSPILCGVIISYHQKFIVRPLLREHRP